MHLYVAGPMTGIKGFNFQNFVDADAALLAGGHTTFNPAVHEIEQGIVPWPEILEMEGTQEELAALDHEFSFSEALVRDMTAIAEADGVILLPGWQNSSGATLEVAAALWTGKRILTMEYSEHQQGWMVGELEKDEVYYILANFFLGNISQHTMDNLVDGARQLLSEEEK